MHARFVSFAVVATAVLLLTVAGPLISEDLDAPDQPVPLPAPQRVPLAGGVDGILPQLDPPSLRAFAREVLTRHPEVARARARAAAAAARAPQVRALPDPMASLTLFLLPPETRVGPQRAMVGLSQRLPWFSKLRTRERMALLGAAEAEAQVEAARLSALTEARRLYWELAFLDAQEAALAEDRETLGRYEELARSRYAAGMGLAQSAIKLQAEISRTETRLLELAGRRVTLLAAANALRDRPAATPLDAADLPSPPGELRAHEKDPELWHAVALRNRPELAATAARIAAAGVAVELAELERKPDLTLGLGYTVVERRTDAAGRRMPPTGNGNDILGLTGSINLPVWKERIEAGITEALSLEEQAREEQRSILATIEAVLGDSAQSLPLIRDRHRLLAEVLAVQAGESLHSAEAGYAAGTHEALDLLDAERTLLDVRIATARARTDYQIALARLEGALGAPADAPLAPTPSEGESP